MKLLLLSITLVLVTGTISAQEKSPVFLKVSSFYRHSPMVIGNEAQLRAIPFRINPDDNLSGLGLGATVGIYSKKLNAAIQYTHSIHMGVTHHEEFYVDTIPNSGKVGIPITKLIHDLELDIVKYFGNRDIKYFLALGGALMNLNTHYIINEYETRENGHSIDADGVGNMVLGGAKLGFGAEYNRLAASLTLFLCGHSVYQNKNPFIFPELKVSYSLL